MSDIDARLAIFARIVLAEFAETPEWDADTLDAIAWHASVLKLATTNDAGTFKLDDAVTA